MDKEYARELEAWASTLAQAQRDIVSLAVAGAPRPLTLRDTADALAHLAERMRRSLGEN